VRDLQEIRLEADAVWRSDIHFILRFQPGEHRGGAALAKIAKTLYRMQQLPSKIPALARNAVEKDRKTHNTHIYHTHIHIHTHSYTHTHTHMHAHRHTHTHTHTHTHLSHMREKARKGMHLTTTATTSTSLEYKSAHRSLNTMRAVATQAAVDNAHTQETCMACCACRALPAPERLDTRVFVRVLFVCEFVCVFFVRV
jgi:hypothetical protein